MKLKNKAFYLIFTLLLSSCSLFAEQSISLKYPIKDLGSGQVDSPKQGDGGHRNSNSNSGDSDLSLILQETEKNNFEMNSDEAIFQKAINSRDRYNKLLNETLNLELFFANLIAFLF